MLKEEKELREWISKNYGYDRPKHLKILKLITALVRAVQEDICGQVADAIKAFPKKTQVELLDAIMRYEKPKAIRKGRK